MNRRAMTWLGALAVLGCLGLVWISGGTRLAPAEVVPVGGGIVPRSQDGTAPLATPAPTRDATPARAEIDTGPEPVVAHVLEKSGTRGLARGTCVDAATGEPIPGVPVEIVVLLERESAVTDARGRFAFDLPSGPAVWVVLGSSTPWILEAPKILLTQAQQDGGEEIRLRLHRAMRVEGRVVDEETREPVPGLTVRLRTDSGYFDELETDASGSFVSSGALPHERVHADFWDRSERIERRSKLPFHGPAAVTSTRELDETRAWVIEVPIGPTYYLDLGEIDDATAWRLSYKLLGYGEDGEAKTLGLLLRTRGGDPAWIRYREPVRRSGLDRFALEVADRKGTKRTLLDIDSVVGVHGRVLQVVLDRAASFRVHLEDAAGEPLQARVFLVPIGPESDSSRDVETSFTSRGVCSGTGLVPGSWRLIARVGTAHATRDVTLQAGSNDLGRWTVEAPAAGAVSGSLHLDPTPELFGESLELLVLDASGDFVTRVRVPDRTRRLVDDKVVTDFETPPLPPGEYTVRPTHLGPWQPASARCRPGDELRFTRIEDVAAGALALRVIDADTSDSVPADVTATWLGVSHAMGWDEERGAYVIDVPVGEQLEWTACAPGFVPVRGSHRVSSAGEPIPVELRRGWGCTLHLRSVEEGASLVGQDEDQLGRLLPPLANVRVLLDGEPVGVTDANGSITLRGRAEPGRIEFEHPDWRVARVPGGFRDGSVVGDQADVVVWMARRSAGE